ncbi:hypothetical protein VYU27_002853 [Nannochloropsis oceanica]
MGDSGGRKKEIYSYQTDWLIFAMAWNQRANMSDRFRIALGSCIEEYNNKIRIIERSPSSISSSSSVDSTPANANDDGFHKVTEFDHPYPATKVMWCPDREPVSPQRDLLATTGDYLRIWNCSGSEPKLEALLNNNKNSEYCAPLTSFDWNKDDPSLLGTACIDTTCTIWDVNTQQAKTQIIAHDKEVYDIAFARGKDLFASVGADGSVRMFDLRSLVHSTIIYESPELTPLLRLAWNKQDPNYLAAIMADSAKTFLLDIRKPSSTVAELGEHQGPVNSLAWAPHSACHICTCGEDRQALIWDLTALPGPVDSPILAYAAQAEVNTVEWFQQSAERNWVAIGFDNQLQVLRV